MLGIAFTGPMVLGNGLLVAGIVEGALLVGWRLTQLPKSQALEFLLVSLLAFQRAQPEQLAALEGSIVLLERLERQFPPNRLTELRAAANRLAGNLTSSPPAPPRSTRSKSKRPGSRKTRRL